MTISYDGKEVQLWTYQQLSQQGLPSLKSRALNLRDIAQNPTPLPRDQDGLMRWILLTQSGMTSLPVEEFGAPAGFLADEVGGAPAGAPQVASRGSPMGPPGAADDTAGDAYREARSQRE